MYVRLGLINGDIMVSDDWDLNQISSQISDNDGRLGTGDFAEARVENVEDAIALMERIITLALISPSTGWVSIDVDGETLNYKSTEVAWYRIVR